MNKTQTRGNCPCCGREQAVLASGKMSKHGYTVECGWFNGVCSGDRFEPMQIQRKITDDIIEGVRNDVAKLTVEAGKLKSGKLVLKLVAKPGEYVRRGEQATMVEWASLDKYDQQRALDSAIYDRESRARMGTSFANDLEALVNRVHGTPLIVVELAEAPAPIRQGEKRQGRDASHVLTARYTEKGRVYFTGNDGFKGWDGIQSWRRREVVA